MTKTSVILQYVRTHPHHTAKEIIAATGLKRGTVTGALSRMETRGQVTAGFVPVTSKELTYACLASTTSPAKS